MYIFYTGKIYKMYVMSEQAGNKYVCITLQPQISRTRGSSFLKLVANIIYLLLSQHVEDHNKQTTISDTCKFSLIIQRET